MTGNNFLTSSDISAIRNLPGQLLKRLEMELAAED